MKNSTRRILIGFVTLVGTVLSAILYRMGGSDKYNTKARDIGVPITTLLIAIVCFSGILSSKLWIALAISFLLEFGSLTTYWKKKGTDAMWFNWMFTGFAYSMATLPVAFVTGNWLGFGIRTVILTASTTIWSEAISKDTWEEWGRGALINATYPLLLIG